MDLPLSDLETRQELWKNSIPVVFYLTPDEVIVPQPPNPYYALLSRTSYLPTVISKINEHFANAAPVLVEEMWFEFENQPLKWHYPLGVLFDLLFGQNVAKGDQPKLPWKIIVHFRNFPEEKILHCKDEETWKNHFFNSLKQSNFIKESEGSKVNDLSVADSEDLWEGLKQDDFQRFWKANSKLIGEELPKRNIPLRIFLPGKLSFLQRPVSVLDEQGNTKKLDKALNEVIPELNQNNMSFSVLSHGIVIPLETPINWLQLNCAYSDGFVYLIIVF